MNDTLNINVFSKAAIVSLYILLCITYLNPPRVGYPNNTLH